MRGALFLAGVLAGFVVGRLQGFRLGQTSAVQYFIADGCEPFAPLPTGWKWS